MLRILPNLFGGSKRLVASFNYVRNQANQRTNVTLADSSAWAWQYDKLGQVIAGRKRGSSGQPVAGQQFSYGFDDIGVSVTHSTS